MVRDKRRPVQAIFRDRGSIRSDDHGDGKVYHAVNVAFKRHQVMSKVEWGVYCEVIGELLLAFSHQHGSTQLTCWKELRNLSKTRCDNYAWELLQIIRRSLPESDTTKILVLQALFDDMLNKFDAPRHRLSHLIQGMLDVNARILQYGSTSDTEPEDQLLKRVWLKLKIWYRSVPLTDSNPLVVAWCSFVMQYKYLGTANESTRIDEEYLPAYTNVHALLQLALDLETTHAEHVHLDANPPRFLTVDYSGIVDQPAPGNHRDQWANSNSGSATAFLTGGDRSTGITQFSMLEHGLPYASRNFDSELDAVEELHAAQGVSGRNYAMVDKRVPDRLRGRSPERGRESFDRGRSPTRRWGQQSGYHEQIGSRGVV